MASAGKTKARFPVGAPRRAGVGGRPLGHHPKGRPVQITLSAEQRDALYDLILDRLSGLGDLWLLIELEEYATADRLGREFSDDLRLILDDLGWGGSGGSVTLTLPPADLRRIFSTLREHAISAKATREQEEAEERFIIERADQVTDACDAVLAALPAE